MDVFFYEAFKEEEKKLKRFLPNNIQAGFSWKTIQECNDEQPPAKLISTRTQSIIPIEWSNNLSGILSRSTGFDHLTDYQKKIKNNVSFGYLPHYCQRAVAEHAMMLWMSLLRKLPQQIHNFSSFNRNGLTGFECKNKTILIVGVGNIGCEILKIAKALEMKALCVDIDIKYPEENYVRIDEGISQADIIVCAMNLTKDNIGYFNYDLLKKAKRNAIFINVSRGEFSPASILLKLMNENHLGGIGLDVYNQEKELAVSLRENKNSSHPEVIATIELNKKSNVIFTPHNAFNSHEAVERKAQQSIEQIEYFLENKKFKWQVPE